MERGTPTDFRFNPHPSVMVFNYLPAGCKSDAEAGNVTTVKTFQWVEDSLLILGCNANPVITNTDDPFLRFVCGAYMNAWLTIRLPIFDRISEQVLEDLCDSRRIHDNGR